MAMRVRNRTTSDPSVATLAKRWQYLPGTCTTPRPFPAFYPSAVYTWTGSYVPNSKVEQTVDDVTPDFFRKRDRGEIINNPFSKTTTLAENQHVSIEDDAAVDTLYTCSGVPTYLASNSGLYVTGTFSPATLLAGTFPSTPSLDVTAIKNLAITGAFANIDASSIASLPAIAESEKTIQSLMSITKRLVRLLAALRKFDVGRVYREFTPKALSERWMEGRYAIRPLVYDMYGIVEAINAKRHRPTRQTYRSGYGDSASVSEEKISYTMAGRWRLYTRFTTSRVISARAGVLTAVQQISEASIWGLDQPMQAMWELIPFSFVVDWFLNVGKVIASWAPKYGFQQLASWVTVKDTVVTTAVPSRLEDLYVIPANHYLRRRSLTFSGGYRNTTVDTLGRAVNPNRPILPTFNVRLDAAKLLDLVLIGKQNLRA